MSSKFIGHDVSVFNLQAAGQDNNAQSGITSSLLGRWESIEVTLSNEWANVSPADAFQPEKRWKMANFTGSCKGFIDTFGSQELELFGLAQLVIITFTESNSGKTMVVKAGISKSSATFGADSGKDTLDFEDVGAVNFGGGQTFFYS